jgi:3-phosphoglycerate kinase
MVFTFLAALGHKVGASLLEVDQIETVKGYLARAKELGVDQIPIIAKNMQSALAKLCQGDFYTEDQVINVSIFKKE